MNAFKANATRELYERPGLVDPDELKFGHAVEVGGIYGSRIKLKEQLTT